MTEPARPGEKESALSRLDDPLEDLADRQASRWFKPGQSSNVVIRTAWKAIIFVVGMTVVLAGVAMLVLPGPAIIVIPAGLAILATEFVWARHLLVRAKGYAEKAKDKVLAKKAKKAERS